MLSCLCSFPSLCLTLRTQDISSYHFSLYCEFWRNDLGYYLKVSTTTIRVMTLPVILKVEFWIYRSTCMLVCMRDDLHVNPWVCGIVGIWFISYRMEQCKDSSIRTWQPYHMLLVTSQYAYHTIRCGIGDIVYRPICCFWVLADLNHHYQVRTPCF